MGKGEEKKVENSFEIKRQTQGRERKRKDGISKVQDRENENSDMPNK